MGLRRLQSSPTPPHPNTTPIHASNASLDRFDNLAHVPRGTASDANTLRIFRLHRKTATMTLLAVDDTLQNPAFLRFHPKYNVLYACTEDITRENEVLVVCLLVGGVGGGLGVIIPSC